MTIDEIERLVGRLEATDLTTFEFSDAATRLKLRFAPQSAEPRPVEPPSGATGESRVADPALNSIRAPAVGVLRLRHPNRADDAEMAFPRHAQAGEIIAYLEAGSCLRPVIADSNGMVGTPLQPDGALVGYGTPLFPRL